MRKFGLSVSALAVAGMFMAATPSIGEDEITPYAHLNLYSAWVHKNKYLGEGLILTDEVADTKHAKLSYQSDVAATAVSHLGIMGEKNGVTMKAEFGVYPYTTKGPPTVTIRYLYAATHFGPVELRGGYDMAPYVAINRNEVADGEILSDAAMFDSFQPQIRLSAHGVYVQFMRSIVNNSDLYLDSGLIGIGELTTTGNTRYFIPKTAIGYVHTLPGLSIGAHGVFQTYSIDDPGSPFDDVAITAMVGSVAFLGEFGPLSLNISGFVGQNPGELGIFTNNNKNGNYQAFNAASNNKAKSDSTFHLQNTFNYGVSASGGWKMGNLQFNAGGAYDRARNKVFKTLIFPTEIDDSYALFANCMISLRPNLKVTPSVKIINYLNTPGNAFLAFDATATPVLATKEEGVFTRFGFAFQASI